MLAAKLIEGFVFVLTVGWTVFALVVLADLLRLRSKDLGPAHRGGVGLVAAVVFHAFNGLRTILFDFWPQLALHQRPIAYVESALCAAAFAPAAFFMPRSAWQGSPFS